MPSLLQRLGHRLFRRFCIEPPLERPDTLHQVVTETHAEPTGLSSRERPSGLVLREAMLGGVGRLSHVDGRQGTRLLDAAPVEFDDLDRVDVRRSTFHYPAHTIDVRRPVL